jgi:hypothetical protein
LSAGLTWPKVIGRRLARHHLLAPAPPDRMVEVAGRICGVHAQVAASAELMLGARVSGITRQDVRAALWERRTLVKTVGLRGTLHLFPADEIPIWMAANRLRFDSEDRRHKASGIDPKSFSALVEAISAAVGPEPIGKPELERELEKRAGAWAVAKNEGWMGSYSNWPRALGRAAALGRVCYGPAIHGGRVTYVRLSDWSGWREEDTSEAARFVLRRFLRAYGPSTPAEFGRWFGLEPGRARSLFAELGSELAEVEVEGERRQLLAADVDGFEPAPRAVQLLPHFDVFVVGSHPRNRLMTRGSPVAAAAPGTAANLAVLLVGGEVAGVWDRRPNGRRLRVRVDAHRPLTRRQKEAVAEQAERAAAVLEMSCDLEFGTVPLRFHL